MNGLSAATWDIIQRMFPTEHQPHVAERLINECGNTLPLMQNEDEIGLEHVRFAVLKLSSGNIEELRRWVGYTKLDWRDTLMAAGFAHSVTAHHEWYDLLF